MKPNEANKPRFVSGKGTLLKLLKMFSRHEPGELMLYLGYMVIPCGLQGSMVKHLYLFQDGVILDSWFSPVKCFDFWVELQ